MVRLEKKIKALRFCLAFAVLLTCAIVFPPVGASEPLTGFEYEVKMGFIYNFINFVTWPEKAFNKPDDAIVVCFASDDPSSNVLFQLSSQTIRGRKIEVLRYTEGCVAQSHVFFFGTQDRVFIQKVLDVAKGRGILTIGEIEGFTQMGGIINFFEENNRLRFKVNIDAAKEEHLTMSSQLLVSAQIVTQEHK
jgi:hypothetical protein